MPATEPLPLITIITPTFNASFCIDRCIQSVINQTYIDVEHLIIDGQSTDNTIAIVQQYQENYPQRIRLVSERDKGIYDAMNKGVQQAKGKWLFFLGADDFLYNNNVLKKISTILLNTTNDIVYGNVWMERINRVYDGIFDIEKLLKHNFCHQAVFYKALVFVKMGLYNLSYKIQADYDFNLRCLLSGIITFQYVPDVIAFHASGGVSTELQDEVFVKDFPETVIKYTLQSNYSRTKKIDILATIYRKLLLRYSLKELIQLTFNGKHLLYKCIALTWTPFAFLFRKNVASTN